MAYEDESIEPQKVIVFDWDDTICPSSFVDRWQVEHIDDLPVHFQRLFGEVAKTAERCLHEASKYGEVIIITNSDDGWVKFSCERFVPRLLPALDNYRVVSARTLYERFYPSQPLCWKAAAFAHEVNELYESCSQMSEDTDDANTSCQSLASTDVSSSSDEMSVGDNKSSPQREIISFGDSLEERTAVRIVADQLSAVPKSVMFIPSPSPADIIGQLHMVTSHMKFVCDHDNSLDLEISTEQAARCADSYMKRNRLVKEHSLVQADITSHSSSRPQGRTEGSGGDSGGDVCVM